MLLKNQADRRALVTALVVLVIIIIVVNFARRTRDSKTREPGAGAPWKVAAQHVLEQSQKITEGFGRAKKHSLASPPATAATAATVLQIGEHISKPLELLSQMQVETPGQAQALFDGLDGKSFGQVADTMTVLRNRMQADRREQESTSVPELEEWAAKTAVDLPQLQIYIHGLGEKLAQGTAE
jgi:ribosomal protein L6P/L9E